MRERGPKVTLGVLTGEEGALLSSAWCKRKKVLEEEHPMGHPQSEEERHQCGVRGLPREGDEPARYQVYIDSEAPAAHEELATFLRRMCEQECVEEQTKKELREMLDTLK
jgi:hypothetical protein